MSWGVLFTGIVFFLGCAATSFLWTLSQKQKQGEIESRSDHV